MNVYIIEPHKNFDYCGGVLVVVANTFKQAVELAKVFEEARRNPACRPTVWGDGEYETAIYAIPRQLQNGTNKWVLTEIIEASDDVRLARVVTWNYNYA